MDEYTPPKGSRYLLTKRNIKKKKKKTLSSPSSNPATPHNHTHSCTHTQFACFHNPGVCFRDSDQLRTAAQQPQVRQNLPALHTRDQHVLGICRNTKIHGHTHTLFELFFILWLTTSFCLSWPQ